MSNAFLIDRAFSRKYEEYFCDKLMKIYGYNAKCTDNYHDDHGIDIVCSNGMLVDVKCYRKPRFTSSFDGVFIETYLPRSGRPGWYLDEKKKTNCYIFVIDCDEYNIQYSTAICISKAMLKACVDWCERNGYLSYKQTKTGHGFILPYECLLQYGRVL